MRLPKIGIKNTPKGSTYGRLTHSRERIGKFRRSASEANFLAESRRIEDKMEEAFKNSSRAISNKIKSIYQGSYRDRKPIFILIRIHLIVDKIDPNGRLMLYVDWVPRGLFADPTKVPGVYRQPLTDRYRKPMLVRKFLNIRPELRKKFRGKPMQIMWGDFIEVSPFHDLFKEWVQVNRGHEKREFSLYLYIEFNP